MKFDRDQLQKLYQYCFSLTRDPVAAEDLLQTSLEKWISRGKAAHTTISYVRKIIRNQFIDDYRRKNIVEFETIEEDAPALLDETSLEDLHIQRDLITYVFSQLATSEREILYLWAMFGYTAAEIAEDTGQPRGTVLSRLHRIKQKVIAVVHADEEKTGRAEL